MFGHDSTIRCEILMQCSCQPKWIGGLVVSTEICKLIMACVGFLTSSIRYQTGMFTTTSDLWDTIIFLAFWMVASLGVGTSIIGIIYEHSAFLFPTIASQILTIASLLLLPYFREGWVVSSCILAFVQLLLLIVFLVCYADISELERSRANWDERPDVYTSHATINGRVFGTKLYYRPNRSTRRLAMPLMPLQKLNELDEGAICTSLPTLF